MNRRLEKIAIVVGILGFIGGFGVGDAYTNWTASPFFKWGACIVFWAFSALITITIFWMGKVLSKLEYMEECAYEIKNSNDKMNELLERYLDPNYEDKTNTWKCPNCGKFNPEYVGTCSCGEVKKN